MIEPGMKTPPADSSTAVTTKYTEAFNLNARIRISAQMAQQNLYEVCKGLKEMRDGKLYKELGYQNFEEYTENEVGIKRVQAHKYITIIENLGEDFVSPGKHLGMSKLYLLSTLSEEERAEITEKNDVESISKRELEEEIKKLRDENKRELEMKNGEIRSLQARLDDTGNAMRRAASEKIALDKKNRELESQIKELESRPVEVAVQVNNDEVEKLKSIIKQTDLDWAQKYNEMEDENVKLRRADFQKHVAEIESIKKEYEEKLAAVPKAEPISDTKEVFKAYLSNAVDSANRLLGFVNQHKEELFISKTKEFFSTVTKKLEV